MEIFNFTRGDIEKIFEVWESQTRTNPDKFMTQEDIHELTSAEYGKRSAKKFLSIGLKFSKEGELEK